MSSIQAAAGVADLEPRVGSFLTGFAARMEKAVGIHDPIEARALMLDDGLKRVLIVSCDLLGLSPITDLELREQIARRISTAPANVFIACTHTHGGPASMPLRGHLRLMDNVWFESAREKIVELAASLPSRLEGVSLRYAHEPMKGIGFNRQDPSDPIDEQLTAISLDKVDGETIATVVIYATHPVVLGPNNLQFSADFPGATVRALDETRGGVSLFLQGTAGDVNPAIYRAGAVGSFEEAKRMGRALARSATRILAEAQRRATVVMHVAEHSIGVPLDPPPPFEEIANLIDKLQEKKDGGSLYQLDWARELHDAMRHCDVPDFLTARIAGLSLNELILLTAPFEVYSQIGLDVKARMQSNTVCVVGYTGGLIGYCCTRKAKAQGGYGPEFSHRFFPSLLTGIGIGADDLLTGALIELANKLKYS